MVEKLPKVPEENASLFEKDGWIFMHTDKPIFGSQHLQQVSQQFDF